MCAVVRNDFPGGIRRREVITGLLWGLGAGMSAALPSPAYAIGRHILGDSELITISDGTLNFPVAFAFPGAPPEELRGLLAANGLSVDSLMPDCNVTLLRSGGRLAIFDAGSGPNFVPTAGLLVNGLQEAGIDPTEVTDVYITHAHPDHLWGVADEFDELVFPNASYHIGKAEWEFWSAPDTLARMPEDRQSFVIGAQNRFTMIEDRISFVGPGQEVMAGVEALDTSGHTPGHMSFMVHGNGESVLIGGDALTQSVVSFAQPEWPTGTDQDPDRAAQTRLALLERLASDRSRLIGYHLPHPGLGVVRREGNAYRFEPV